MAETSYPSLSVVVPSYNQGQFLEETILSVIGQQYPNLELIVIDGGSTDNTLEVLEKYSAHIAYWHSRRDNGQGDAINQGMTRSSGDVVCWLNSDDMYLPGTLLDVGSRFKGRTEECHLIYGGTVELGERSGSPFSQVLPGEPYDETKLTYWDLIVQPSSFWTRRLWQETGDINVAYNYVLDWDWFIRASKFTSFEYVPRLYSIYRFHPHHKTTRGGIERMKEIKEVVRKYAPVYWSDLYDEVHAKYDTIVKLLNILYRLKIPKRNALLLPLFFPRLRLKLRNEQDFYRVLTMYRPDLFYLYESISMK